MSLFLWYPKCSTCKRVKSYLDEKNISYELRNIKEENPSKDELLKWCSEDQIDKFFNTSGLIYKELCLKDKLQTMNYQEKIELLSTNGMLIKRPILILEDKVLVGPKEIETK